MYPYPRSQSTENKWKCWVFTTTLHHEEGDFSRAIMNHDRRFRFFIWNLAPLKYGVVDYLVTTEQYSAQPLQSAPIWMWDRERAQRGAAIFITSPLAWSGLAGTPVQCEYGTYSSFMLLLSAARRKNVPILYNTMKGTRKDFVGWTWTTYYYIFNSRLIVGNNIFWASMSTAFVQTTECVLTDRNKSVWKVAICLD